MNRPVRSGRNIRLVSMAEAEFDAFFERSVREYARDKVLAGQWNEAGADALARQALSGLLPRGPATPDHHLYVVFDAATERRVGTAWLHCERGAQPPFAYLNDIRIDDASQGQGFGRATLRALEAVARAAGCGSLRLHAFGHNERARRLYEGAGYRVTNVNMRKDLES